MFPKRILLQLATLVALFSATEADLTIYTDSALAAGWEDWSWSSVINYASTDEFAGTSGSSISVNSSAYAALSVKLEGTFPGYAGLRFDIAGAQPDLSIFIQSTGDNDQSPTVDLSTLSNTIVDGTFSSLLINFNDLPGTGAQLSSNDSWDRITFQAGGNGAFYHIDNIVLVEEIVIPPLFLSAEPILDHIVAVTTQGAVDLSTISVSLNGNAVKIVNTTTYVPVDTPSQTITYLELGSNFDQGNFSVTAGNTTFSAVLPAVQYGSVVQQVSKPINPHIYGVNFPTSASYIQHLGVTISRWGGNAVTAYNFQGDFTNAGNDWYFENRAADDGNADAWLGWVSGAGSDTLLTVPALDWVAKDTTSFSYPATIYPDQAGFDPYNSDAGNGQFPNGSWVPPLPQSNVYKSWNTSLAKQWLSNLANKPLMVAIDNEIEIASNTHQDMHPDPIGYDEELARVISFATAAKEALPDVLVVAPSTCSWWYYWTSEIGYTDNAAHYNIDFLPWFLAQMKAQENSTGTRLIDYLDLHYYFQADTSANDDAAKALRLRMTRSLWDTSYVDESWVGTSAPQNHQWNPTAISLIPRFQILIDQNYPGMKLSISEWSSTDDTDITGGLVTVDVLGLFGQYGVDSSTYWATPDEMGPIGLAYWLYRGYGTFFASATAQVNLATPLPDTQGVYAGTQDGKLSLVIVNKNPDVPISFYLANVPTDTYFVRHFGGQAGVAKWQASNTSRLWKIA
ncbi:glycoside hydrolase family 44 protein [Hypholoma sublateritium FD-334 SS-4]|uniref:Glycoside hydrolase family 44 protein n=1 Tax=Hypholoma sublateritium (strain FD-334 SS-4) TaxID=945553 RepID=A0A0D2PEL7_HYPSF|nr:glycoside hydrolase family 44 protein [Hypholoma sublateritium FD-334 SS-4]